MEDEHWKMFWEITWWSPNLNWKQGMDLTIRGSLINLQSILFTPVQPCTNLPDTFCWNPPHPVHLLAEVHLCLPAWCPLQSKVPDPGPVDASAYPMWLLHSFPIWIATPSNSNLTSSNNPRCPPNCRTLFTFRTVRTELAKSYNLRWNSILISCRPQEIGRIHGTDND